jgi:hypothetical protein
VSESLPIIVSALAEEQIRAAAHWWRVNRSKAPDAFREDLDRATSLLAVLAFTRCWNAFHSATK